MNLPAPAATEAANSPYQSMLETALSCNRDAKSSYANADPQVKRLWNRTLIERIEIKGGQLAGVALKQPFAGLFLLASSNKGTLVGRTGHNLNSEGELGLGILQLLRGR
jgi:hypothetical protein